MGFPGDRNAFFMALTHFGTGIMSSILSFYYVKLFLDVYRISQWWFHFAQAVYLIWNAVNDPLFAYWQDNSNMVVFRSRRHSIMYGAPLFALSFLLFWFPWREYSDHDWLCGLHLTVALCCYDSLFTFVLLAHCALYTEISSNSSAASSDIEYRLTLTRYSKAASVVSSFSLTAVQFVSDGLENYRVFQMSCVLIAVVAWLFMYISGANIRADERCNNSNENYKERSDRQRERTEGESLFALPYQQLKEIMTMDFVSFVATNFLQTLHMTYTTSFMVIFADQLIPEGDISDVTRKLIYGSSSVLPTIIVLAFSFIVSRYGYHAVIKWTYVTNIAIALLMYYIGQSHTWLLASFLLIDICISGFVFSFFNLPLSDIIDKDKKKYNRKGPLSSTVFGYNALLTKPAQSVAPMVVVAVLDGYGYGSLKAEWLGEEQQFILTGAIFNVVCLFPVVLSLCSIYTWSKFTIRDSHVGNVKTAECKEE